MSAELEGMANLYDEYLLELLKSGRTAFNDNGELVQVPLSASDLNVIRQRLKDCGITAVPTSTNPIGHIVQELAKRGRKLPEISDADDAATA
tara:strand:+ start:350 stop:625 length:276 start_codon:yes stop_codon:yes gene_type:complete